MASPNEKMVNDKQREKLQEECPVGPIVNACLEGEIKQNLSSASRHTTFLCNSNVPIKCQGPALLVF